MDGTMRSIDTSTAYRGLANMSPEKTGGLRNLAADVTG